MRQNSKYVPAIAGIVMAGALTAYFAHFLWSFDYLPGTDAYYYALQAQSLLDRGQLKVPDHGAIHYAVAAMAGLGLSVETAFRLTLTGVFAIYQAGMAWLFLRVKEDTRPAAAFLWIVAIPVVAFHAIEFPALTLGLSPLPIWFWLAMKATRTRIVWLAALLTAGILVHPGAAALATIFAVAVPTGSLQTRSHAFGRRWRMMLISAGVACIVLGIVVGLRYPGLVQRVISLRPGPPGIAGLIATQDVPEVIKLTVPALWLLLCLLLVAFRKTYPRRWVFLSPAALALPLWPDRVAGLRSMGGRLSMIFLLMAVPLLIVVSSELAETESLAGWNRRPWIRKSLTVIAMFALAFLPAGVQSSRTLLIGDDYSSYERVVAELRDLPIPMLIAHRGLDFFYSYRLRRDAFHFDPEPEWNQAGIWRVAAQVTPEELAYYSPQECRWGQTGRLIRGTPYLLVREDCWERFRLQLNKSDNPDLYAEAWEDMENPSQARPGFLRARRRLTLLPGPQ